MPETAAGIAIGLGMQDFTPDALYRPVVSIRFGARYLSAQRSTMNGNLQGALAAYNGGPGNATMTADLYIYQNAFAVSQMNLAAAAATLVLLAAVAVVVGAGLLGRLLRRGARP